MYDILENSRHRPQYIFMHQFLCSFFVLNLFFVCVGKNYFFTRPHVSCTQWSVKRRGQGRTYAMRSTINPDRINNAYAAHILFCFRRSFFLPFARSSVHPSGRINADVMRFSSACAWNCDLCWFSICPMVRMRKCTLALDEYTRGCFDKIFYLLRFGRLSEHLLKFIIFCHNSAHRPSHPGINFRLDTIAQCINIQHNTLFFTHIIFFIFIRNLNSREQLSLFLFIWCRLPGGNEIFEWDERADICNGATQILRLTHTHTSAGTSNMQANKIIYDAAI